MTEQRDAARRALVVCADDYAMSEPISRAIRELLERGRVSATSCLSVAPAWPRLGLALREHGRRCEIGLHVALTDYAPLGPMPRLAPTGRLPSARRLTGLAYARRLPRDEIAAELARQLDAFEAVLGCPPAFVDGHHHCHVLPTIRETVIELLMARGLGGRLWVRSTCEPIGRIARRQVAPFKAAALAIMGRGLRRRLDAAGIMRNDSFRGVTDLGSASRVASLFERFLRGGGERPLLICHPGHRDPSDGRDPFTAQRAAERAYLQSDAFARDLTVAGFEVARWSAPVRPGLTGDHIRQCS